MSVLDPDELLHLALHSARSNDPQTAIEHLKRCLEAEPANAKAIYLLGALYAQIGMYARAKEFLRQAIELDRGEYTAIFQLGLLHLTSGEVESARLEWAALDALDLENYFYLFKSGLLALIEERFADCVEFLERGICANTANEALNGDMQRIKVSAEAALAGDEAGLADRVTNHLVLSGYQQAQP